MGLEYAKRSLDMTTTSISSLNIHQSSHPVMSPLILSAVLNPEDIQYVDLQTNITSGYRAVERSLCSSKDIFLGSKQFIEENRTEER